MAKIKNAGAMLLTVGEAAVLLGISRWTMSDMIRRGEIAFIPWRGSKLHKRIPRAVLDEYIKRHTIYAKDALRATDGRRNP